MNTSLTGRVEGARSEAPDVGESSHPLCEPNGWFPTSWLREVADFTTRKCGPSSQASCC